MRIFNSYIQFCNMSYWGPTGGPAGPRMGKQNSEQEAMEQELLNK